MNWYSYVLVAMVVFVGARLLKLLPHSYELMGACAMSLLIFILIPLLLKRGRQAAIQKAANFSPSAQTVLARPEAAYLLYLRSFESDARGADDGLLRQHLMYAFSMPEASFESSLISALNVTAPVVAIGKPASDAGTQLGALRHYVPEGADWQDEVLDLVHRARAVIFRLDEVSVGVAWELEQLAIQRHFRATAVLLSTAKAPDDIYLRLLDFLPADVVAQLPPKRQDIVAVYVDTNGVCRALRQKLALLTSIEHHTVQRLAGLVRDDLAACAALVPDTLERAFAGVRCWHRKGIGLTPLGSYAGKLVLSSEGFKFLSVGASLMPEILQQASPLASANLTLHLDDQALTNAGSLLIGHASLLAMEVRFLHIRVEYFNEQGEIRHCALALDGMTNSTRENLEGIVLAYIQARRSTGAGCPNVPAQADG